MTLLATLQAKTPHKASGVYLEHGAFRGREVQDGYLYTEAEHAAVLEKLKEPEDSEYERGFADAIAQMKQRLESDADVLSLLRRLRFIESMQWSADSEGKPKPDERLCEGVRSNIIGAVVPLRSTREKLRRRGVERAPVLCPDCDQPFALSFTERRVTCGCKK